LPEAVDPATTKTGGRPLTSAIVLTVADPAAAIPNKLYFRIGEVSRLAGVKPSVVRYWETEFPGIAPKKTDTGQRMYRRREVERILAIRDLLYEQRYTIEGARRALAGDGDIRPKMSDIRRELEEILDLLD